jgi:hypothetical protein
MVPEEYRNRTLYSNVNTAARVAAGKLGFASTPAKLAGKSVRQLIDPCNAPMARLPDEWTGKSQLVKSVHVAAFNTDDAGERGIIIDCIPRNSVRFSGTTTATYSSWNVPIDDPLYSSRFNNGDYKYMRCVGYCVNLQTTAGANTTAGSIRMVCTPALTTSERTGSMVGLANKQYKIADAKEGMEYVWCPAQERDFIPYVPTAVVSSTDLVGREINDRAAIHVDISGAAASTPFEIRVTKVYECFLDENAFELGGKDSESPQNRGAMDNLMNAVKQITWDFTGQAINKIGPYGAKIAAAMGRPGVAAGLAVGSNVLSNVLGSVSS